MVNSLSRMLADAAHVPTGEVIETDLCIIGAGPAGITLARELAGHDIRVCVLESGDHDLKPEMLALTKGESIGRPYFPLFETRARAFGGSTRLWPEEDQFRIRPLDPIDFETREGIPHSGWPFSREHLDPFYDRAYDICAVSDPDFEIEKWETDRTPRLPLVNDDVYTTLFLFSDKTDVFPDYMGALRQANNVSLLLHANVVELVPDSSGTSIGHVEVAGLWTSAFTVKARAFVLAAGGIENARLLLASRRHHEAGLGNENDLVGRYFMEHLRIQSGLLMPRSTDIVDRAGLYSRHLVNGSKIVGVLVLSPDVLRRQGLLNSAVYLREATEVTTSETFRSMATIADSLRRQRRPDDGSLGSHLSTVARHPVQAARILASRIGLDREQRRLIQLTIQSEQAPNPSSRVTLSDDLDPLGYPLARLSWQLTDLDYESVRRTQSAIDKAARNAGVGRMEQMLGTEEPPVAIRGHWHHMGTTRMHSDPRRGVVDPNCRVHTITNLYVAGSSVFPTGGYANPTVTIVALALRLADHLKTKTWA